MDTRSLERFATAARRTLIAQVTARLEHVRRSEGALRATHAPAIDQLEKVIKQEGRDATIERVAYTWFNRFCALRYMDANHLQTPLVVSPAQGESQPQILQQALQGSLDGAMSDATRGRILDLLMGRTAASDPQQEAYRLLVVAACNGLYAVMPFLFQPIDDYTELLMPPDLLSGTSILADLRRALPDEVCKDVEVIGWLYQFYISEKKDEIDAKVKKGGKVEADELPAKTSLYTPHWIVRYLVENSLGRLWLLNHPHSRLAQQMEYYIAPKESDQYVGASVDGVLFTDRGSRITHTDAPTHQNTDVLVVNSPEEITLCDPACGSGHMLTYAFDLLYAIYEEQAYSKTEIPRLILEKNLYGLDIDERSANLAAFALVMKAAQRDNRFLKRASVPQPHITHVHALHAPAGEPQWLKQMAANHAEKPARDALLHDLDAWRDADYVGSLLRPRLTLEQIALLHPRIPENGGDFDTMMYNNVANRLLDQAEPLARKYHVVVTNPPYIGGNWSSDSKAYAESEYPSSKSDFFAMFIERNLAMSKRGGLVAMITMQSWMFLSSYETLRKNLLAKETIVSMAHVGARAFDTISGEIVSTTAFVLEHVHYEQYKGTYLRLVEGRSEAEKQRDFMAHKQGATKPSLRFSASAADFKKIPGSPIAYWVSDEIRDLFFNGSPISDFGDTRKGMATGKNDEFVRHWSEIGRANIGFSMSRQSAFESGLKWFPYANGGGFRKWFGNLEDVVIWQNDGIRLQTELHESGRVRAVNLNLAYIFREGLAWTSITSGTNSFRRLPAGSLFSSASNSLFADEYTVAFLALLNSSVFPVLSKATSPTLNANPGDIAIIPVATEIKKRDSWEGVESLITLSRADWDAYETSWDFADLPLLREQHRGSRLANTYRNLRDHWQQQTLEMQRLEEENNRIFIDAYGLQDELTPDVPLEEITLTANPHYRYGGGKTEAEYEKLQRADTVREFIHYAVGCIFGRYSLDKPGLILANQGEGVEEYARLVSSVQSSVFSIQSATPITEHRILNTEHFLPDADNVLPILDGDWFADDIVARCKEFLRVTFGEPHFVENLAFVEEALGKELRAWFVRDFYDYHVRRYQKRPIYWLFSSEGGAFNALVYMHRYRPDTASVVLNNYLRPYRDKVAGQHALQETTASNTNLPAGQQTKAQREADRLQRVLNELDKYERDVLYPLATERIAIDLDDGVKVNYAKFGKALRAIK